MNTNLLPPPSDPLPPDVQADLDAIAAAITAGRKPDPEVAKRVRERADQAREDLFRKHGVMNIAVDLIREIRDEE